MSWIGVDSYDCVSSTVDSHHTSLQGIVFLHRVPSSVRGVFGSLLCPRWWVGLSFLFRPMSWMGFDLGSFVMAGFVSIGRRRCVCVDLVPSTQDLPSCSIENGGWRKRWGGRVLIGRNPRAGFPRGGCLCKPGPADRIYPNDESNQCSNRNHP